MDLLIHTWISLKRYEMGRGKKKSGEENRLLQKRNEEATSLCILSSIFILGYLLKKLSNALIKKLKGKILYLSSLKAN